MTIDELGAFWLQHREEHGKSGKRGPLRPSTLAAYEAALRTVVSPALGGYRISEIRIGLLERALAQVEVSGTSTAQARAVLNQMLGLAVRREILGANPMREVEKERRGNHEVHALSVDQARHLRRLLDPRSRRRPNVRGPNRDLPEVVDFILGTGCRIGEALAVRWSDLDLTGETPTVHVCGTLIEPRGNYVEKLFRQPKPKGGHDRTLILPSDVVVMLVERHRRTRWGQLDDPVFASSRSGRWVWPNNIRTRLRVATNGLEGLSATTPHTLRRTVGTLIAHERGTDAARDQLGHVDGSVTGTFYVAKRRVAPDLREVLNRFFVVPPNPKDGVDAEAGGLREES
jgi:integrase